MSAASHKKMASRRLYTTPYFHIPARSPSVRSGIYEVSNLLLKQNYRLEATSTCPQPNGSQTSEAEKMNYQNLTIENIFK